MKKTTRKTKATTKKKAALGAVDKGKLTAPPVEDRRNDDPEVAVSMFGYSVENHLKAVDTMSRLCGEPANGGDFDKCEIERLAATITFLREWMFYKYEPRGLRFARETGNAQGKDVVDGINLPQFSAARVPEEGPSGSTTPMESSKDFVLYVGGPVWALDWCPRVRHSSGSNINCEFVAVAAHPPDSSYHKIGAPLTGRGIIQIWCLLNVNKNKEEVPPPAKKPKRLPKTKKTKVVENKSSLPKKPRGRPRKKPIPESSNNLDCNDELLEPLAVLSPEDSSTVPGVEGVLMHTHESNLRKYARKRKGIGQEKSACKNNGNAGSGDDSVRMPLMEENEDNGSPIVNPQGNSYKPELVASNNALPNNESLGNSLATDPIPNDVALPRIVLCLAHNGKVAWDAKWRPSSKYDSECKHRMGYLAVILGSGSLEVWEVPTLCTIKTTFSSSSAKGIDPRFVKLKPVFQCSKLKCGDRESIPLTIEWSSSFPHDFILAGCHDGTVALWKFSPDALSEDTRPLLSFSADTVPIRALAWAPVENDPESANVIVTAGHGGLKFWDIRDPFRPLWDLNSVQRVVYSLDWLPDPRGLLLSLDDGTLKIINLAEASYDVPISGKPFDGAKFKGLHTYGCTSFAIWSVQVSRATGMAAYCCADGSVLRFQLTAKAVEKDPTRNRAPNYLCGSMTEEKSILTVNTPLQNNPVPMRKHNAPGDGPTSMRGFLVDSNKRRVNDQKTKAQISDDQTLALCYGDDPGAESVNAASKSKNTPKSRSSSKKTPKYDQALACRDEEPENIEEVKEEGVVGSQYEVIPPKLVAMHRVRWNINKGSEKWLCSGGAAGIVRCQEINLSDLEKKLYSKK